MMIAKTIARITAASIVTGTLLFGCAAKKQIPAVETISTDTIPAVTAQPAPAPLPPPPPPIFIKPRVALVLGGGAARGFAHIGVIRELEKEKIPIDLIVGTSVGSLIGALYAANPNTFELEWTAFKLEKDDIFDFSILSSATGPVRGDRLEKFVLSKIPQQEISKFKIPFYAVAADLNTGAPVIFSSGPVAKAVRASCSIPGIFTPLQYENRMLVDGGVLGNIAPEVALQQKANIIIVVSIGKSVENKQTNNIVDITMQAISIMSNNIDAHKAKIADVMITPDVGDVGTTDFSQKKRCMEAGMKAASASLPEIIAKIERVRNTIDSVATAKQNEVFYQAYSDSLAAVQKNSTIQNP